MTSFYRYQKLAFQELDGIVNSARENKIDVNVSLLILNLTSKYEVSDKSLRKRLQYWTEAFDDLEIKGTDLRIKSGQESVKTKRPKK